MALSKSDREWIYLTMESVVQKQLQPIVNVNTLQDTKINKLAQTVYGENGDNGLRSDVRSLKNSFGKLIKISGGIQVFVAGVSYWIGKHFQ